MSDTPQKRTWWMPPSWLSLCSQYVVLALGLIIPNIGSGNLDNWLPTIFGWRQNWKSIEFSLILVALFAASFNLYASHIEKQKINEIRNELENERLEFAANNISQVAFIIKKIADINPIKFTPELVKQFHQDIVKLCCDFLKLWKVEDPRVSFYIVSGIEVSPEESNVVEDDSLILTATVGRRHPRHNFFTREGDIYNIFQALNEPERVHQFVRNKEELQAGTDPIISPQDSPERWKRCARVGVKDVRTSETTPQGRRCAGVLVIDSSSDKEFLPGAIKMINFFAEFLSLTLQVSISSPSDETLQAKFDASSLFSRYDRETVIDGVARSQGDNHEPL